MSFSTTEQYLYRDQFFGHPSGYSAFLPERPCKVIRGNGWCQQLGKSNEQIIGFEEREPHKLEQLTTINSIC